MNLMENTRGPLGKVASANLIPALLCLALIVANHSIFRLGTLSLVWALALLAVIAAVVILCPSIDLKAPAIRALRPTNVLIGSIIVVPLAASIVLGWNREFPFHGDHNFHIRQTIYFAHWWISPIAAAPLEVMPRALIENSFRALLSNPLQLLTSRATIFAVILAASAGCYRWHRLGALILAVICFTAWGLFEHSIYYRYPGAWYFLAIPFLAPAYLTHNLELAGRLANALAPLAWLFLLRPYFIGRWPDFRILPLAAFVLWQQDVLYFFDSSYLEPWAVIFSLLAVELLIVNGRAAAPVACLMVGIAAAFKEPPILALPFVWLAGEPWRGTWTERAKLTGAGLAAGFPFVLYFVARKSLTAAELAYNRPVSLQFDLTQMKAYAVEYLHHMSLSFDWGSRALAIVALVSIPVLLFSKRTHRMQLACLAACGVG
ncbi:MAG: hypothetical protein JO254_08570, partial [Pseudolabrys sp.]|nr:hypothetical protein [Pseudolabrys sp.]